MRHRAADLGRALARATALADSSEWEIEVHEKRPRPAGAASASDHVDDIVLRARRRPD